jgi:hypothetical protein
MPQPGVALLGVLDVYRSAATIGPQVCVKRLYPVAHRPPRGA